MKESKLVECIMSVAKFIGNGIAYFTYMALMVVFNAIGWGYVCKNLVNDFIANVLPIEYEISWYNMFIALVVIFIIFIVGGRISMKSMELREKIFSDEDKEI